MPTSAGQTSEAKNGLREDILTLRALQDAALGRVAPANLRSKIEDLLDAEIALPIEHLQRELQLWVGSFSNSFSAVEDLETEIAEQRGLSDREISDARRSTGLMLSALRTRLSAVQAACGRSSGSTAN